jgi:hypothetical protein
MRGRYSALFRGRRPLRRRRLVKSEESTASPRRSPETEIRLALPARGNSNVSASPRTSSPSGNCVRACIRLQHITTAAQGGIGNEAQDNCSAGDLRRVRFRRVRARARSWTAIQQAQVRRQEPQFQLRRAKATSLNGLTGHATAPRSRRRGWTDSSAWAVMNTIGAAPARAEDRALSWPTWRILVADRHFRRVRRCDADVGLAQTEPRRLGCVGDHVTHAPEYPSGQI